LSYDYTVHENRRVNVAISAHENLEMQIVKYESNQRPVVPKSYIAKISRFELRGSVQFRSERR